MSYVLCVCPLEVIKLPRNDPANIVSAINIFHFIETKDGIQKSTCYFPSSPWIGSRLHI